MKKYLNFDILPWFPLGAGFAGLLLRIWLYAVAIDEKGLIMEPHIASTLVFILVALVMVILFACTPAIDKRVHKNLPASGLTSLGQCIAAVGIVVACVLDLIQRTDTMTVISSVLGIIAAVSLVLMTWLKLRHKANAMVCLFIVTVYLTVHPVCQYRYWSPEPQLQNYAFQLLSSVFLMVASYHRTMLENQGGYIRWYVFYNQAALFFSILSLNTKMWAFYLAMAIWTVSDLFTLKLARPGKKPPVQEG